MASVKEANEDLSNRYTDKDLHTWVMNIRHLSDCTDKVLNWGRAVLFIVSMVATIFGFNAVLVLAQEFGADNTVNIALVIQAVICAFLVGKAERGVRTISIDKRFRKLVGNDNIVEKYAEIMVERAGRR